jgi:DNA-binding XRE family transcriptional regulator
MANEHPLPGLREIRERLGLTKRALARLADVSPETIANAEAGKLLRPFVAERPRQRLGDQARRSP